jgi:hypothetical protein
MPSSIALETGGADSSAHGKIVEQDETFKVFGFGMAELKVWWAMWEWKAPALSHPLRPTAAWIRTFPQTAKDEAHPAPGCRQTCFTGAEAHIIWALLRAAEAALFCGIANSMT